MRGKENTLHALKQLILDKTQGTPFFMEEMVQELFEQGVLVRTEVGAALRGRPQEGTHIGVPLQGLRIPPTVQGILAARIDRLAPEEKALLQQLSVIGRQFPLSLIRQVIAQPEADLYRLLTSLQHKEFLYEQPALPESEYIFKHALTQEVAYDTVLQEQRKALHEQTARAIEALYRTSIDEHYGELAHHFNRSGNTEKAIEYLQLAGQQAVQRSANIEAIDHLTTALDFLMTRPETPERAAQELTLHLAMGPALMVTQGHAAPAVERHYTRARALYDQLGDTSHRFPVLWGLWLFHGVRGDMRTAQALAEECLQLAEQTHEAGLLLQAYFARGAIFLWRGELIRARQALERSLTLYQPQHHALTPLYGGLDPKVLLLGHMTCALWSLGYPKQALTRSEEALQLAQELGHVHSLVNVLYHTAVLQVERGNGGVAQEHADMEVALASEQGFPDLAASGTIHRGGALMVQSQWAEGVAQIQQGLETAVGELHKTRHLAWLAAGYEGAGQVEEGLAAITEALWLVEKNDERFYEAEMWRIKGTLTLEARGWRLETSPPSPQASSLNPLVSSGVVQEAEGYFLKAIEIAQKQQAKSLELRAVMSLARLWQSQGKTAEAREILAPVYDWFTEGFDTKDLQEAKMLLAELSIE